MLIRKNWKGYVKDLIDNKDGTYTVKYFSGREDILSKNGIVKAIDTAVNEFIECEKEKIDIVDTTIVKVDDDTLKDILKDEGILESFEFVRENQDKLKEIIKNMKVVEFNGRKIEDSNDNENKVKIEIPD